MVKKYKKEIIFFYICAIIAMIVGTFYDMNISESLYNKNQTFSLWFYATGEMPARLLYPLAGTVILYVGEKNISKILGLLITLGGSIYLGYHIGLYMFKDENKLLFSIIFGLGIGLIIIFFGKYIKFPNVLKKPLLICAYAGVTVTLVEFGIENGLKIIWTRERFRQILIDGNNDGFTPWYQMNLMKNRNPDVKLNEYKSLPSGHSANAAVSYLAMLLPCCFEKLKDKTLLCFAIPFVYTSVVAYTRIVLGAHFLTDVTIGATITFSVIIICMSILDSKKFSPLMK